MIKKSLTFFLLFSTLFVFSQRNTSSPYSIFGVGEEFGIRTVEQISMGGIGAALNSNKYVNLINPAANSNLVYSTYIFGVLNNDLTIKTSDLEQTSNTTSLSYFALAVPLIKGKFSILGGMQPTSGVGYSLRNSVFNTNDELVEVTQFSGSGSVNRLFGGFAWKVYKGFSIGAEIDFLFGNVENSVVNSRENVDLSTRNTEITDIRGGTVKLGAHYENQFKNDIKLSAGVTAILDNTLRATGNEYLYSLTFDTGGGFQPRDTVFQGRLNGRLNRPIKTIMGLGIGKANKWYAGLNYQSQKALNNTGYFATASNAYRFGDANRISFGGFFTPKENDLKSYFKRMTYRFGVKYEQTGLEVNGTPGSNTFTAVDDFGISFGLGLPLGNRVSNINFGAEVGRRGSLENGLIQENYFNIRLSLSLNDIWFKKRYID